MDSRQESGNQASTSAAPQSAQYHPDEVHYLKEALHGANSQIGNLHCQRSEDQVCWEHERRKMCHKIHNGRYRANRLQDIMGIREKEFKDNLEKNIQTISKQELEISRLNTGLKLKDVEIEAAKRFNKEQMEKNAAQLEAQRQINSELRDQMFKASLEIQRAASLLKETQMKLDLEKQQVQQRDSFIEALRKEKEDLSQKLFETSTQLKSRENESFQKDPQEEKYKALQEKFMKEMEEKEQIWTSRIQNVEQEKSELVEENQKLCQSVKELETENKVLAKTNETLTTQIDVLETSAEKEADQEQTRVLEVETENKELVNKEKILVARIEELETETEEVQLHLKKKKKKTGFFSKTCKGKTDEEQQKEKEENERKQREKEEQKKDEQRKKEQKKKDKEEKTSKRSFWKFWSKKEKVKETEEAPCSL